MIKKKKGALCVEFAEKRHFIRVPAGQAQDLFNYLRTNRVNSAPPEPLYTGFDCIELPSLTNVDALQILLNGWT